ncbi:hypothetical protein QYE76_033487 [Lolium multiflorum]|uniref:Uncharacterized protein n=1 Tax=Lolium multiflorum TaxID=4521 RepID=A0AAD8VKC7_LOLMU|nr:hypothetical protein QYE76_033487 [Lolium multiflorum]
MARARARAVLVLLASSAASSAVLSPVRATASSTSHALTPAALSGARAASRATASYSTSHGLTPAASSGARATASYSTSHGLTPAASSGAPRRFYCSASGPEAYQACSGTGAPFRGHASQRMALFTAYAAAALYTYLDSEEVSADEVVLPKICYPANLSGDCSGTYTQMSKRGPPLPTKRDVEEIKIILLLILREVRKPKSDDLIDLLKAVVVDIFLDPTITILFPYLSLAVFIEVFGQRFVVSQCPFSGLIEAPPFDATSDHGSDPGGDDGGLNHPDIEWGENLWPEQGEAEAILARSQATVEGYLYPTNLSTISNMMSINEVVLGCGLKCVLPESEGAMLDQANRAKGEAAAVIRRSESTAEGMRMVFESMSAEGNTKTANLRVAEQYIEVFAALAKNIPSALIAWSMNICGNIFKSSSLKGGSRNAEEELGRQTNLV